MGRRTFFNLSHFPDFITHYDEVVYVLCFKFYVDSKEMYKLFSGHFIAYEVVNGRVVNVVVIYSTLFIHLVYIGRPFFDYKFYTIPEILPYFDDEFSIFL